MTSHLTSCWAIISTIPFSTLSFSIHTSSACTYRNNTIYQFENFNITQCINPVFWTISIMIKHRYILNSQTTFKFIQNLKFISNWMKKLCSVCSTNLTIDSIYCVHLIVTNLTRERKEKESYTPPWDRTSRYSFRSSRNFWRSRSWQALTNRWFVLLAGRFSFTANNRN